MKPGDIIRTRSFTHYPNERLQLSYKAPGPTRGPKRMTFVMVVLGYEKLDSPGDLDLEQRMAELGWQRIPESQE